MPTPIQPTIKYPNLVSASWINIETNEENDLIQKFNGKRDFSSCLFSEQKIEIEKNIFIQFRFDYSDINSTGDPMLDADFFDKNGEAVLKTKDMINAHHTPRELDISSNRYIYVFTYRDTFRLKIIFQKNNNQNIMGVARIIKA